MCVLVAYGPPSWLCFISRGSRASGTSVAFRRPTSAWTQGMKTPWRWGHCSILPWVGMSSLLTGISGLVYRIGRLMYSFSSKSVTIRSRTRLLTPALFFLSRVDKDIFAFDPLLWVVSSENQCGNLLKLLPLSRKAHVMTDLSLPFNWYNGHACSTMLKRTTCYIFICICHATANLDTNIIVRTNTNISCGCLTRAVS